MSTVPPYGRSTKYFGREDRAWTDLTVYPVSLKPARRKKWESNHLQTYTICPRWVQSLFHLPTRPFDLVIDFYDDERVGETIHVLLQFSDIDLYSIYQLPTVSQRRLNPIRTLEPCCECRCCADRQRSDLVCESSTSLRASKYLRDSEILTLKSWRGPYSITMGVRRR